MISEPQPHKHPQWPVKQIPLRAVTGGLDLMRLQLIDTAINIGELRAVGGPIIGPASGFSDRFEGCLVQRVFARSLRVTGADAVDGDAFVLRNFSRLARRYLAVSVVTIGEYDERALFGGALFKGLWPGQWHRRTPLTDPPCVPGPHRGGREQQRYPQ